MSDLATDYVESKPAPGTLRVVQEFINTRDIDYSIDSLSTAHALWFWLCEAGLLEGSAGRTAAEADGTVFETAIAMREALRVLLWANNGGGVEVEAARTLRRLADALPVRVTFDDTGAAEVALPAPTVRGVLGALLGEVLRAQADGTWVRLKACANPGCRWIFYDASMNRVGRWCRMSACGNRAKSRAHRMRLKNRSDA